jgi:hypothetical protein
VQKDLRRWQKDTDLGGIGDVAALGKRPAAQTLPDT